MTVDEILRDLRTPIDFSEAIAIINHVETLLDEAEALLTIVENS
jgi:hypothetical protein